MIHGRAGLVDPAFQRPSDLGPRALAYLKLFLGVLVRTDDCLEFHNTM